MLCLQPATGDEKGDGRDGRDGLNETRWLARDPHGGTCYWSGKARLDL